ncbi:MAG: hypothetical protein HKN07_03165 [Acidimicrobiia bacterium]|nr:hypothetical protein [Acidimicrobiia bacterium]
MANPDPKHGRWILPLVIFALVGFTYVFVNNLPPASTPAAAGGGSTNTTVVSSPTTTTPGDGTTTTSTTLIPQVAAFLDRVADVGTRADALALDARTINEDWDARSVGLSVIQTELARIQTDTAALVAEIQAETPPEALAGAWSGVALSAGDMETAAAGMITGLASSDDGTIRRTALLDFEEAVAGVNISLDLVDERARG